MAANDDLAPNNYYRRLSQVTRMPAERLRNFGKSTHLFWRMLASWLAANDYELGRPTAVSTGSWKYVGLAMSQAVVRAGDRKTFHDLFESYGFSASDLLTVEEIRPYLSVWINSSRSNNRLRAAWKKKELHDRICEVAVAEFHEWSSSEVSSTGLAKHGSSSRLSLIGSIIPIFPRPRLSLNIGLNKELPEPINDLRDADGNAFSLNNALYGAFATISPNPIFDGRGGLAGRVDLEREGGRFAWAPRLVIPLARSADGPYWAEVARLGVGRRHMLLVRKTKPLLERLHAYLADATAGTSSVATQGELPGVPVADHVDRYFSSQEFCANSCHTMKATVAEEFETSAHGTTRTGVVPQCRDCHIDENLTGAYFNHIVGTMDLYATLIEGIDTVEEFEEVRAENANRVRMRMVANDSKNCRSCHVMAAIKPEKKRGQRQHAEAIEEGITSIVCHYDLVHKETPLSEEFDAVIGSY